MCGLSRAGRELEVQLLLDDLRPAVVALSETELAVNDRAVFKNYTVHYPLAVSGRGFRLLLLVREDLAARFNPTVIRSTSMELWIRLEAPCGGVVVAAVYRQWSGREEEDLEELDEAIRDMSSKYERIIVMGDLNLNLARRGDPAYYRHRLLKLHLECLEESGLIIANEMDMSPTFFSHGRFEDKAGNVGQKFSILDHVYHRGWPRPPSFTVLPIAMTDHRPTLAKFDLRRHSTGLRSLKRRNFKSISSPAICLAINAENLSKVFAMGDVEAIHGTIITEITAALDLVAPLQEVQIKDRKLPLYLSNEALLAIRGRDRAATTGNHSVYRRLRNEASRLVRRDKLASNLQNLQREDFSPKAVWHLANEASGRSTRSDLPTGLVDEDSGERIRGDDRLADCVNTFYINKINKIRAKIDRDLEQEAKERVPQLQQLQQQQQQRRQQQQQQQQHIRFRFRAPSEKEILATIAGLNNTKALGIDGVPVAVLKLLAPIIAAPVAHLVRKSLEQARIPSGFKMATVIPLHKRNKPAHQASSYRPVSILPAFSKVLERVVLRQLSRHLAPHLPPTQFGFRPRRGTTGAITYAHGSWAAARAKGLVVAVAGYDLSSAFDTIDVGMVTSKLKNFGVVGKENGWFLDYLSDRHQQVLYNSSRSSFRAVRYGVPQGSILGPLLFLVLVADLPGVLLSLAGADGGVDIGVSTYADDTLCWVAGERAEQVRDKLEELSDAIVTYATKNYLALNEAKTQVLWSPSQDLPIRVGSCLLAPADKIDVLGVSFDKTLSPTPHLHSLISSAKTMTAMARRLSLHLPRDELKTVMGSLLRGKIGYACAVLPPRWQESDTLSTLMAQLQVNVNNVARSTIGCRKSEKITVADLLRETGFPSLNRMVVYTVAMECWRALSLRDVPNGPLNPLGCLLSPPNSDSGARSRTRAALTGCLPPPSKVQVNSFIWWAYTCWNSSPALRKATNVSAAKKAANDLAASTPI